MKANTRFQWSFLKAILLAMLVSGSSFGLSGPKAISSLDQHSVWACCLPPPVGYQNTVLDLSFLSVSENGSKQ